MAVNFHDQRPSSTSTVSKSVVWHVTVGMYLPRRQLQKVFSVFWSPKTNGQTNKQYWAMTIQNIGRATGELLTSNMIMVTMNNFRQKLTNQANILCSFMHYVIKNSLQSVINFLAWRISCEEKDDKQIKTKLLGSKIQFA